MLSAIRRAVLAAPGALWRTTLTRHLLFAIAAGLVIAYGSGMISDYRNFQLAQIAVYVIAVAGLSVLIGQSGQISVGNGAFMAIGGYVAALLLGHLNWSLIEMLPAATAAAALCGAVFGIAAARLRGPYLAGATLMLAVALPSLASKFPGALGGDQGLGFVVNTPGFLSTTFSPIRWQGWVAAAAALVTLVLLANLLHSRIGRHWRAVRDDEIAASLAGLNVARLQILAFTVSAACAGLAGTLLAYVDGSITPSLFALTLSIQLLVAAVLGGLGSLPGAIWGSAAVVLLQPYLQDLASSHGFSASTSGYVPIVGYGVVLIAVMLAFPVGIQGGLVRLARAAARPVLGIVQSRAPGRPSSQTAEPQEKGTI